MKRKFRIVILLIMIIAMVLITKSNANVEYASSEFEEMKKEMQEKLEDYDQKYGNDTNKESNNIKIKNIVIKVAELVIGTAICAVIYFIPTITAAKREHINKVGIVLINIFLGWTLVGWVGALVWACIQTNNDNNIVSTNKYEELEKLQELKEKGAINAEEFKIEKQKILK